MKCWKCKHTAFWIHTVITYHSGGHFILRRQCKKCRYFTDSMIQDTYIIPVKRTSSKTLIYSSQTWEKIKYYAKKKAKDDNEKLTTGFDQVIERKKET